MVGVGVFGVWIRLIPVSHSCKQSQTTHQNGPPRAARREEGEEGDGLQELARLVHDHDGDLAEPAVAGIVAEGG